MQCIYNVSLRMFNLYKSSYFLVFYHFGFETTTSTFSCIINFDGATNLFKQVYSCTIVDACLAWTDLIILISRPVRWDKLYQSTHFKEKLYKLPINIFIIFTWHLLNKLWFSFSITYPVLYTLYLTILLKLCMFMYK